MKITKEFKIGLVVIASIGFTIWGINFLKGTNLFSNKFELYAVYPKIDGLIEANPLLVNGFKVGQIKNISLTKINGEYAVLVKFLLTEDVQIPKRSVAKAISSDLLGSKAVELIYSDNTEFVESGDTLLSSTEDDLKTSVSKQIAPLQAKAVGLISSIDSVMEVVQFILNDKTRDNLNHSFESIQKALGSLEQTAYKLDDLVASERTKISSILTKLNDLAGMLEKNTGKIDNIIGNFSSLSDSLSKSQLKSAIREAEQTLTQFNKLATDINAGKGTVGKLMKNDSLYNNLTKASDDLDKLLKDLRLNPNRYVHISVFGKKDKAKPID